MRKSHSVWLALALMVVIAQLVTAQNNTPKGATAERKAPLVLTEAIPLEGVKGRFDHFAFGQGRVFVSALGNNSVEVINTGGRTLDHTIPDVPDPQGVAFSPEANKLFVASGRGKLYIYDGTSYNLITTVDFKGGADNLRYDPETKRVYVGCGNNEQTGAIGMVDAMTNMRLDEEYKLGSEPESFQLENSGPHIYVNLPQAKQIAVINRATKVIIKWSLTTVEGNTPMALDESNHRLFVSARDPASLAIFDTASGHLIATLPGVVDSDDLYFDPVRKRIYMPGREGFIYVYLQNDPDHYRLLAKIPTALGAGTAGYFGRQGKGFDRFFLAVPAHGGQSAEIRIYSAQE